MNFKAKADYKVADAMSTSKLTAELKPVEGLVIAIKKNLRRCRCTRSLQSSQLTPSSSCSSLCLPPWRGDTKPGSRIFTPKWHSRKSGKCSDIRTTLGMFPASLLFYKLFIRNYTING
jgi:hypothetical protein